MASVATETIYAPPPGPPPPRSHIPSPSTPSSAPPPPAPLLPTNSPIPLDHLSLAGWYPIPLSNPEYEPIHKAYRDLFALSETFFALPDICAEKVDLHPTPANKLLEKGPRSWHTEDGWSMIPGEKQLLSVRHARHAPSGDVREGLARAWRVTGPFLHGIMRDVARSLGLEEGVFDEMIEPCLVLPGSELEGGADEEGDASPTLMRMFRYDRPVAEVDSDGEGGFEAVEPKVVSEAHRDLGLVRVQYKSHPLQE